jgi:hypothetical protein
MTEELHGRELIESRFGPLAKGLKIVMIGDGEYDLRALLARMDLALDDLRAFDVVKLSENHFVLRYYDGQDQQVVAHEFDAEFRFLAEHRAHVAQWIGEDAYYDSFRNVQFRCPLVPGEDF